MTVRHLCEAIANTDEHFLISSGSSRRRPVFGAHPPATTSLNQAHIGRQTIAGLRGSKGTRDANSWTGHGCYLTPHTQMILAAAAGGNWALCSPMLSLYLFDFIAVWDESRLIVAASP